MERPDSTARLKLFRLVPFGSWVGALPKYGLAIGLVILASLLRYALSGLIGSNSFAVSLIAILLVAWLTGLPATLLAQTLVLAIEITVFGEEQPRGPTSIARFVVGVAAFYLVGIAVSVLSEAALAAQIRGAELAAEAIQERGRLQTALACMSDGVVITDRHQQIMMINPAAERMLGSSASEVIGKPLFSIVQATESEGVQYGAELVRRAIEEDRSIQGNQIVTIKTTHNDALPVRYNASPMVEPSGASIGAILVIHDETERQLAEQRLKEADRRKDDFLATLAHELRNPLAPISTGLELMRLSAGDPQIVAETRERMERQTQHMVRLVDDLLDVSRIAQGKLNLKKEQTELRTLIREVADTIDAKLTEADLKFTKSLPDQECFVVADPHRITQVITNLIDNSIKFTPRGGDVAIELTQAQGAARIFVRDSGVGIPAELQESIFGMFTQLKAGHTHHGGKGLGIGLALSKSLMEMHDGGIRVKSGGINQGCEFELTLPIMPAKPIDPSSQSGAAASDKKFVAHRILVVDDNRDALVMLSRLLEMLGHSVKMAQDGAEAIELAQCWRPDVVFMDIGMPIMSGHEAARRMRQEEWGKSLILVATTGWAQEQDRMMSHESGFNYHLVKPVNLSAIDQVLASQRRLATTAAGE